MTLHDAMAEACRAVGIVPPARPVPGRWVPCPVEGKGKANGSGRVMLFGDDRGGIVWNWTTGEQRVFRPDGAATGGVAARDREAERSKAAEEAARRAEAARLAARVVAACATEAHPYLAAKGFPDERGLVIDPARLPLPAGRYGEAVARALPEGAPLLVIPGRIGRDVVTVQWIAPGGEKKNLLGGVMSGTAHRIATGRETWVCEGIATALSVRAALRLLGRSATVLCAFAAANVGKVAADLPGAIVAADHDKPLEHLGGLGTGEFHARASGRRWVMPPEPGDFNDWHQRDGLRAVAMLLREVRPP